MKKAYDSILGCEIDAVTLAKNTYRKGSDYFRYQCLCCGEEVYLAAADSTSNTPRTRRNTPHFRHRTGNNDTECELYLGTTGAVERCVSERKRNQRRISFCFNNDRKTFEIGVMFQNDELAEYSSHRINVELKRGYFDNAFLSVPIDKTAFIPGVMQFFTIDTYSHAYYVNINGKVFSFDNIFSNTGKLIAFKTRLQDNRAGRVFSKVLYTDTRYIVISEDKSLIEKITSFANVKCVVELNEFYTMGKIFYSADISIIKNDYALSLFFSGQEFQLENSESFDILWPPVCAKAFDYVCEHEKIYVSSSFPVITHGNTNANCNVVNSSGLKISEIELKEKTVVYENNVDVSIIKVDREPQETPLSELEIIYSDKWTVPDDYDYYLFDQDGCRHLSYEETVYLSIEERITGYKNGHLACIITGKPPITRSPEMIIEDILKYHPQTEVYNPDEFIGFVASEPILAYLEKCCSSGRINTVVKKYIKESLL